MTLSGPAHRYCGCGFDLSRILALMEAVQSNHGPLRSGSVRALGVARQAKDYGKPDIAYSTRHYVHPHDAQFASSDCRHLSCSSTVVFGAVAVQAEPRSSSEHSILHFTAVTCGSRRRVRSHDERSCVLSSRALLLIYLLKDRRLFSRKTHSVALFAALPEHHSLALPYMSFSVTRNRGVSSQRDAGDWNGLGGRGGSHPINGKARAAGIKQVSLTPESGQ